MTDRATPRFALALAIVSTVAILYISLVTLREGHQSRVEARLAEIVVLSNQHSVPLPALMAACVAESHRESARADALIATLLADAMQAADGQLGEAWGRLYDDQVQVRLVSDLWQMNQKRWRRLADQLRDS